MPSFTFHFQLWPPRYFGLPEGDRVVIPAQPGGSYVGPTIDTRLGKVVGHGTLSRYREPEEALAIDLSLDGVRFILRDNFLSLSASGADPQTTFDSISGVLDILCHSLSAQFGDRFTAEYLGAENEKGERALIARTKRIVEFGSAFYNLTELQERVSTAVTWSLYADERARKALLYCENACVLRDFANSIDPPSHHGTFAEGMALLQLTKALFALLGEPGVDSDYQRRFRALGLPNDFWDTQVKPIYTMRNDNDVAHYTLSLPSPGAFARQFLEAMAVFQSALKAYMKPDETVDGA